MTTGFPPVDAIVEAFRRSADARAGVPLPREDGELMALLVALHRNNLAQWAREDDARRDDADVVVAAAKRDIDRLNATRHGYIEEIDRAIVDMTEPADVPLVTESPGLAIDRLSVLVIRLASMEAHAARAGADGSDCRLRLRRVRDQLDALERALSTLFAELALGTRRFHPYRGLKAYGHGAPANADP